MDPAALRMSSGKCALAPLELQIEAAVVKSQAMDGRSGVYDYETVESG